MRLIKLDGALRHHDERHVWVTSAAIHLVLVVSNRTARDAGVGALITLDSPLQLTERKLGRFENEECIFLRHINPSFSCTVRSPLVGFLVPICGLSVVSE